MNGIAIENNNTAKFRIPIVVLSTIALVAKVLQAIFELFYVRMDIIDMIWERDISSNYFLTQYVRIIISDMLFTLFVFLVVYAVAIHKRPSANKLIMIICIALSIIVLLNMIYEIYTQGDILYVNNPLLLIRYLVVACLYILAAIGAAGGSKTRVLCIIALAITFFVDICAILSLIDIIRYYSDAYKIMNFLSIIASILFDVALIFAAIGYSKGGTGSSTSTLSKEERIRILYQQLSQGVISFEEYNRKRDEIIRNP